MIISLQACLELTETFAYPVDKKYVNTVCFRGVRKVEFDVKVYTYFKSLAWKAKKKKLLLVALQVQIYSSFAFN